MLLFSVTSVHAEDDSGESWNIEGYVTRVTHDKGDEPNNFFEHNKFLPPSPSRVFIYFRTDKQKGRIMFFNQHVEGSLAPETLVLTTQANESAWVGRTEEAWASRQWGVTGKILAYHDSPSLSYEVQHEDQSVGHYDLSELEVVELSQ